MKTYEELTAQRDKVEAKQLIDTLFKYEGILQLAEKMGIDILRAGSEFQLVYESRVVKCAQMTLPQLEAFLLEKKRKINEIWGLNNPDEA